MNTKIRKYSPNDKEQCMASFRSNVPMFFTIEEVSEFERFLDKLNSDTSTSEPERNTMFFVLEQDNKILACGGFGDKDNTGVISLAWGQVHKDYHKSGLGAMLLMHRLKQIEILYPTNKLIVDTTQFSFGFFEKYGFETIKITLDYYASGLHRYDMLCRK